MAERIRRPSRQTIEVLSALADAGAGWLYGLQIADMTGLQSGTLYPILIRLDDRGLLESKWIDSERPGAPPRHAYRINGAGRALLREANASSKRPRTAPA